MKTAPQILIKRLFRLTSLSHVLVTNFLERFKNHEDMWDDVEELIENLDKINKKAQEHILETDIDLLI